MWGIPSSATRIEGERSQIPEPTEKAFCQEFTRTYRSNTPSFCRLLPMRCRILVHDQVTHPSQRSRILTAGSGSPFQNVHCPEYAGDDIMAEGIPYAEDSNLKSGTSIQGRSPDTVVRAWQKPSAKGIGDSAGWRWLEPAVFLKGFRKSGLWESRFRSGRRSVRKCRRNKKPGFGAVNIHVSLSMNFFIMDVTGTHLGQRYRGTLSIFQVKNS